MGTSRPRALAGLDMGPIPVGSSPRPLSSSSKSCGAGPWCVVFTSAPRAGASLTPISRMKKQRLREVTLLEVT